MSYSAKRGGYTLVFAIFVLVVMGSLGVYSLYMTSQTVKTVADEDISNQLKLYADSAAELNLLWLSGDKSRSQQGKDLNITFENNYNFQISNHPVIGSETVKESNGTVIIDIVGTTTLTGETLRVTKRVVAKP